MLWINYAGLVNHYDPQLPCQKTKENKFKTNKYNFKVISRHQPLRP